MGKETSRNGKSINTDYVNDDLVSTYLESLFEEDYDHKDISAIYIDDIDDLFER